jgi:uncharacterized membrane protein YqiK
VAQAGIIIIIIVIIIIIIVMIQSACACRSGEVVVRRRTHGPPARSRAR